MANQHTQALEKRAAELAAEQHALNRIIAEIETIIANPVCGKPGHGFKAARKAKRQLRNLNPRIIAVIRGYEEYLHAGKASYKTRQQRQKMYMRVFDSMI